MANDPPKKKRRKNAPKLGRGLRGRNQKRSPPVPPANLDVNPALDDDGGLEPDGGGDHTTIHLGESGASGGATRSSNRGSRKTVSDKKKIKSLQNKLCHQSKSLKTAEGCAKDLKSEQTKLKDKNRALIALEAKAQAAAAKANKSAQLMSNKLNARVARFSSFREKKDQDLKNVKKRAKDKVDAVENAKTAEIAKAVTDSEKARGEQLTALSKSQKASDRAKAKEVTKIQVSAHIVHTSHAPLPSHYALHLLPKHLQDIHRKQISALKREAAAAKKERESKEYLLKVGTGARNVQHNGGGGQCQVYATSGW